MFGNKRIILYIMVVLMTIGSTSYAASDLNEEANYLNALGILRGGTSLGYELDKDLNRVEAAVMIVRLRGGLNKKPWMRTTDIHLVMCQLGQALMLVICITTN